MLGDKLRGLRTQQIRIKVGWKKHQGTREINLRTQINGVFKYCVVSPEGQLKDIFGSKKENKSGGQRRIHNDENVLQCLAVQPNDMYSLQHKNMKQLQGVLERM